MKNVRKNYYDSNLIFKYIYPDSNDELSSLSSNDLNDLIFLINEYYLEYRKTLGLEKDITFGIELEMEYVKKNIIKDRLNNNTFYKWNLKSDTSLEQGLEINSPVLIDIEKHWSELEQICDICKDNSKIASHCGGHVHIGTQILGNNFKYWVNFFKLWSTYENIVYRFTYGDYLTERKSISFALPIAGILWEKCKKINTDDLKKFITSISKERNRAINFGNIKSFDSYAEKNTIEFRCPNGTLNPIIWQNNINLLIKLLLYCKNDNFNNDVIETRREYNQKECYSLNIYKEIYFSQALELADLIFSNNQDKVYFLRQYLKNFDSSNEQMKKAKVFTKK